MLTPYSNIKTKEDIIEQLETNKEFVYSICDNVVYIMKSCIDVDEENYLVLDANQATVLGLFNKQYRLFCHFIECHKADKIEICLILQRIVYEAFLKMQYLINNGEVAQKQYRVYSYRNRWEVYEHTNNMEITLGYFNVRNSKFLLDLEEEGLSIDEIKSSNKPFPSMSKLIEELEEYDAKGKGNNSIFYKSLFGIPSDSIHSDWGEIRQLYLEKGPVPNKYFVDIDKVNKGHYRYLASFTDILIKSTLNYIGWLESYGYALDTLKSILLELERMVILIMKYVFDEYNAENSKYMYE